MEENKIWEQKLHSKVLTLYESGIKNLNELVHHCEGAQPKDIDAILSVISNSPRNITRDSIYKNKFFFQLPASNPLFYQWWFTLETQDKLSNLLLEKSNEQHIACLGTPTIAAAMASYKRNVFFLDIDSDLTDLFKQCYDDMNFFNALKYNAFDDIPQDLKGKFSSVIIDPPWYPNYFSLFISRAIQLAKNGGTIYCSIPQVLTRPGIEREREQLIKLITDAGHELKYIEKSFFKYIVPNFEDTATKNNGQNIGSQPWRSSDLLAIKVNGTQKIDFENIDSATIHSFSRKNRNSIFRVFVEEKNIHIGTFFQENSLFSRSISNRDPVGNLNVWTSEKSGFECEDIQFFILTLECWKEGLSIEKTIAKIVLETTHNETIVRNRINIIESNMKLWSIHADGTSRRTDEEIKTINEMMHGEFASKASKREHPSEGDGFRIEFQRDRDRIIWSSGFRKLSDKTQLFPLDEDDHLRQRLAHSIEVMQLATTIAVSFGLNKDLVEAGALAHDIGHTPFGHAGENALHQLFLKLGFECGFNHYEHGVDVVRYLEGAYQSSIFSPHAGLNLTPEVCDCILKHTYCHSGEGQSHENIWKYTKHQNYLCAGHSHLEGQAVRAADKISYLLSDLEDGIKLGAINISDILSCRLFHRTPIDFRIREGDSLYIKFIEQRGSIIKLLMEDIILESSKRISKLSSINEAINSTEYTIFHSTQINIDMSEVWNKIQVKRLHSDTRVLSANMKASKKICELTLLFTLYPNHIEEKFRIEHERLRENDYILFYYQLHRTFEIPIELLRFLPLDLMIGFKEERRKKVDTYNLVLAKDYVASFSDKKINRIHKSLLGEG
ncbi:dGTP triphosphohydrolase [Shewanella oncorhynchi]|uniref:dGTP triphosphohydrolase n=1 Tax=Shewanella oncorhynchi TaxID=2726434 RepID=UPI003D7B7461